MSIVKARIRVAPDHTISGIAPPELPPGEHEVVVTTLRVTLPTKPFSLEDFPTYDLGPWPEGMTLRREDMYDDDGR